MSIKHLYEDERPALLLDFVNSKTLDPRITFTRNSTATYVDEAGIIKTAAAGKARFDHDPVTGECRGLLIEEQRTNLIQQSTDFTTYWSKYNVTIDPNVETAPDGTTTASKMQWSSSSNRNCVFVAPTTNVTKTHTCSFYAKADEWNFAAVAMQPPGGGQPRYWITVDLTTGDVEEYSSSSPTQLDYDVTPLSNGWWRVSATANVNSAGKTQVQMEVGMSPNNTFGNAAPGTPDGTSGIYIWGAQEEEGTWPSSLIPTSGSAINRVADVCFFNDSNVFGSSSGTFIADATIIASPGAAINLQNKYVFIALAATVADSVSITAGQNYSVFVLDSSIGSGFNYTGLINYPAYTSGVRLTTAAAYAPGPAGSSSADVVYASDGAMRGTNTATGGSTIPTGLYQMYLFRRENGVASSLASGYLHKLAFYPTRLPNSALEVLTK